VLSLSYLIPFRSLSLIPPFSVVVEALPFPTCILYFLPVFAFSTVLCDLLSPPPYLLATNQFLKLTPLLFTSARTGKPLDFPSSGEFLSYESTPCPLDYTPGGQFAPPPSSPFTPSCRLYSFFFILVTKTRRQAHFFLPLEVYIDSFSTSFLLVIQTPPPGHPPLLLWPAAYVNLQEIESKQPLVSKAS